jgi:hypothetical protein
VSRALVSALTFSNEDTLGNKAMMTVDTKPSFFGIVLFYHRVYMQRQEYVSKSLIPPTFLLAQLLVWLIKHWWAQ